MNFDKDEPFIYSSHQEQDHAIGDEDAFKASALIGFGIAVIVGTGILLAIISCICHT